VSTDPDELDPNDPKERIRARLGIRRGGASFSQLFNDQIDRWLDMLEPIVQEQPYEEPPITPLGLDQTKPKRTNNLLTAAELRRIAIEDPELPTVVTPMILRQGEVGHLALPRAVWRELRGSPGSSLTIVEIGRLFLTNQRLILEGVSDQLSIEYSEMEGTSVSDGMLILHRNGKLDPYIELSSPAMLDSVLLFIERARRGGKPLKHYLNEAPATPAADPPPKRKSAPKPVPEGPPPSLEELLARLDKLVGLSSVKLAIKSLVNIARVREMRKQQGLKVPAAGYHMVFAGPPGTGKTTVARLLGQIFNALGLLSKGHLVEVDRAEMVAGFVGQTAIKTDAVVREALGGVLFVDEAYSLAPASGEQDFGSEAIETLLKLMEDNREDLVVIAAGYRERMHAFIESNPGLRSRFTRFIDFPDYSPDELVQILSGFAEESGYRLSPGALAAATKLLTANYAARDTTFGNARMVRNVFEQMLTNQANRLASNSAPTKDDLCALNEEDVVAVTNGI
jgi:Holliday junction resolvasome RuvABC ATP-dependent DNA helicase subunit